MKYSHQMNAKEQMWYNEQLDKKNINILLTVVFIILTIITISPVAELKNFQLFILGSTTIVLLFALSIFFYLRVYIIIQQIKNGPYVTSITRINISENEKLNLSTIITSAGRMYIKFSRGAETAFIEIPSHHDSYKEIVHHAGQKLLEVHNDLSKLPWYSKFEPKA